MKKLSDREKQVLDLISQGKTNAEIADHLNLAVGTVKVHVGNVLSKLGVTNRTAAAHWANTVRTVADHVNA